MQFAGRRTDLSFNPIGEPLNLLVSLSDDVLPEPETVLITGITPQKTQEEGYSEAEALKIILEHMSKPETIILGFNTVRFDDEWMRYTLYRNFYDPYEWEWKDDRSRWDMLDVVRMTRALRPEGIEWPVDANGAPTNRLELLTASNHLDHLSAHDALSDVNATIAVAKMIQQKQPKLFEYLLKMRDKKEVAKLVNLDQPQPFVYASGRYTKDFLHTTVAFPVAPGAKPGSVIVYDLRHDPALWADKTIQQLRDLRFAKYEDRQKPDFMPLPAKELAYNRCPAVAPMGVLDETTQNRLQLDLVHVERNLAKLRASGLADKLREVFACESFPASPDVDGKLYDGFFNDNDKVKINAVRNASAHELADFHPPFADSRLTELLLRYKARNYPKALSKDEQAAWETFRAGRLAADLPRFSGRLHQLAAAAKDSNQQFLLQELQLWAESITPADM